MQEQIIIIVTLFIILIINSNHMRNYVYRGEAAH